MSISTNNRAEIAHPSESKGITPHADARTSSRGPAELETIVQVKETSETSWKEITKLATVSKNGAGFHLSRPCSVGRLVTLVAPLPPELRVYDQSEKLYPVMGLVQYCNEGLVDGVKRYHIGVAFIGKQVPASYKQDPQQNYRITGMTGTGLWAIAETESEFKSRRHPRFWVALEVSITVLHSERKEIYKEQAVTQNIGTSGVSVMSALDANVGDKVKFAYKEFNFYTVAVIRSRKEVDGQTPTLHLEFLDNEFPVERLRAAMREDTEAKSGEPDSGPGRTRSRPEAESVEYQRF